MNELIDKMIIKGFCPCQKSMVALIVGNETQLRLAIIGAGKYHGTLTCVNCGRTQTVPRQDTPELKNSQP